MIQGLDFIITEPIRGFAIILTDTELASSYVFIDQKFPIVVASFRPS